jgi:hypothetical protein
MERLLASIALETHKALQEQGSIKEGERVVDDDCSIIMDSFGVEGGGPYSEEAIKDDKQFIRKLDLKWSEANDPAIQDYYKDKYDLRERPDADKVLELYGAERQKRDGAVWEKAKTAVLHKFLKSEFLVVRTAAYDDYSHGVDNVIVSKKTGDVICALDEVAGEEGDPRHQEKKNKFNKYIRTGEGAEIKYGLTFRKNPDTKQRELAKQEIKDIPIFCLALSRERLKKLQSEMSYSLDGQSAAIELEIFNDLIEELRTQGRALLADLERRKIKGNRPMAISKFLGILRHMEGVGQRQSFSATA